jgi:hypothetical protein
MQGVPGSFREFQQSVPAAEHACCILAMLAHINQPRTRKLKLHRHDSAHEPTQKAGQKQHSCMPSLTFCALRLAALLLLPHYNKQHTNLPPAALTTTITE